jgi:hypothetical protein
LGRTRPDLADSPQVRGARAWLDATEDEEDSDMAEQDEQIVTRVPHALMERIDAYVERVRATQPGLRLSRSDGVRMLLSLALDADEKTTTKPKTKR